MCIRDRVTYNYSGFVVPLGGTFIAPLVFFISLLLVTPDKISRKIGHLIVGGLLIIGYTCITIHFQGLYMVAESGVTGINYHPSDLKVYKLLHYACSSVTSITVVLLIWILTLRKSNLNRLVLGNMATP